MEGTGNSGANCLFMEVFLNPLPSRKSERRGPAISSIYFASIHSGRGCMAYIDTNFAQNTWWWGWRTCGFPDVVRHIWQGTTLAVLARIAGNCQVCVNCSWTGRKHHHDPLHTARRGGGYLLPSRSWLCIKPDVPWLPGSLDPSLYVPQYKSAFQVSLPLVSTPTTPLVTAFPSSTGPLDVQWGVESCECATMLPLEVAVSPI